MGTFKDHIDQSRSNLAFLSNISLKIQNCWDWQVTVCFYSALHLINAHIVQKTGLNYLSHSKVDEVINPYNRLSVAKLDENTYVSYHALYQLSRRSRYLLNENHASIDSSGITKASITYSRHFSKAIRHLEVIIDFMKKKHSYTTSKINIKCVDLNGRSFNNFNIVQ